MDRFLTPEEFSLDNIFKGKYYIPVYQRPYSWGKEQVKQLLKDIDEAYDHYKNAGSSNADDSVLFAGTIFIKTEANIKNEYTEYTVVDGQQRITTLTLLLMALLNHFYKVDSTDDIVGEIRNYLWKKEDRKNDKEKRVLTLGNIDKPGLEALFNELFSRNNIVNYAKEKIENSNNEIEKNLYENFITINDHLEKLTDDEYYDYVDFIKYNIKVISIKINTNMVKLFSIFESINSKGKPLEDIDLIKSYIFQNLNQSDYNEYLGKWGELIKETNDELSDYFTIYIRGNVSYYRTSIKLDNFKTLAEGQLQVYYQKTDLESTLKEFINDMLKQVKYYNMLSNFGMLKNEGLSEESIAIFKMNRIAKYNHTEPLFFKLLSMRGKGVTEEQFETIIEYAFRFILTFQTISSRESKQTISVFSDVQNEIYSIAPNRNADAIIDDHAIENIKYIFDKMIYDNSISNETLKNSIKNTITYKKNKNASKILLAYLLELSNDNEVDYMKLNAIFDLGENIHIDHILPQSPDPADKNFKYYRDGDFMMLKPGQDFTEDKNRERMPVDDFLNNYLHKLGNLRLEWANDNIKKSNNLIKLEEFDELFNSNTHIVNREKTMIDRIVGSELLLSVENNGFNPSKIRVKRQTTVNYDNQEDIEYKSYNPISFTLFGEEIPLTKFTYKQLLLDAFDKLYDLEKDRLVELAMNHFYVTSGERPYMSNNKEDIRKPYVLGNAVYIETNLSSDYIIKFIFTVLDEMGLEKDDIIITLEEK